MFGKLGRSIVSGNKPFPEHFLPVITFSGGHRRLKALVPLRIHPKSVLHFLISCAIMSLRAGYVAYLRAIFPCTEVAFDEKVPGIHNLLISPIKR